jgi:hypothetical protein
MVRRAALLLLALLLAWPALASAQTATPTPVPTPVATPTALPAVSVQLDTIISTTGDLMTAQDAAWQPTAPLAPLLLGLAALVFVFWILYLVKSMLVWLTHAE